MVLGPIQTNCYFLLDMEEKTAVIVDPADRADQIGRALSQLGVSLQAIWLTHGHFDHIGAADELRSRYGAPITASLTEREVLMDPRMNLSSVHGRGITLEADRYVSDGEIISDGPFTAKVLLTPGHTPGGVCYYLEKEEMLLCGDTLFEGSVGRWDFPGGNYNVLMASLEKKISPLPPQTAIFPGHGQGSTIERERLYNPYLQTERS